MEIKNIVEAVAESLYNDFSYETYGEAYYQALELVRIRVELEAYCY